MALLGDGGPLAPLGLDQTLGAILVAHVFFNYAVVVRVVGELWSHLDPHEEDAARVLGRPVSGHLPNDWRASSSFRMGKCTTSL